MSEPKSMGEYLALPEAEKMRLAALPPVRSEPMLAADMAEALLWIAKINPDVPDQRDANGTPYQSAWMASLLRKIEKANAESEALT